MDGRIKRPAVRHLAFLAAMSLLMIVSTAEAAEKLRVVSLKPAITDTIVAMGHADLLVGVTKYCAVPTADTNPEIVGDYTRPYIERIIALKPDIVLNSMENSSRKSVERLEKTGIRVELLSFGSKDEIMESAKKIGGILGHSDDGTRLATQMADSLGKIEARWNKGPHRRILIVWGRHPLVVAGGGSFIDEYLPKIGAVNVMSNTKISYPRIGLEEIIAMDPDVIVDLSKGNERGKTDIRLWDKAPDISAVKNHRIYTLETGDFRPGPRLMYGLNMLAELIHRN